MGGVLRVRTGEVLGVRVECGRGTGRPSKLANRSKSRPIEVAQPVVGAFLNKAGPVYFVSLLFRAYIPPSYYWVLYL